MNIFCSKHGYGDLWMTESTICFIRVHEVIFENDKNYYSSTPFHSYYFYCFRPGACKAGKLDPAGRRLSVDVDALHYTLANHSVSKTGADYFRSSSPQEVNNQSIKADFQWPFSKRSSLDLGVKTSFSQVNNDLLFENNVGNAAWVRDDSRSNLFKYDENINSAYAIFKRTINPKWMYQVGVRVENTIAKGYLEGVRVEDLWVGCFLPDHTAKLLGSQSVPDLYDGQGLFCRESLSAAFQILPGRVEPYLEYLQGQLYLSISGQPNDR